nr:chromosome segregation protein SMC [Candidatus Njordarchaeum guaymaensis]
MYLRKIVLKGFKSFGRKTLSLRFSNGLTTVVGANGSGKSNVLDAVCFTLGILSAKFVRAGSFSDLIYSPVPTSVEKPAEYTRVTLHFDNSDRKIPMDSDDIVVSRQVDRQGHGVYRLNGRLTTRTEILDILSMVGIDPEGYNIVPQGELARIIRLSPEERRQMIEKIAGIATYDEKKERALKELEEVNQNLQRINDKLKMVKDDLERLEKEKNDAVRYQQIEKEIRSLQASLIYTDLTKAKLSLQVVLKNRDLKKDQLAKLKLEEENAIKAHDELSNRIAEIESAVTTRETELDGIQSKVLELRQQVSENENASNFTREKIESNLTQLKSLENKLFNVKKATENTWSNIKTLEDRKKILLKSLEDGNETVKLLSTQISELDNEFDKKRTQLEAIMIEANKLESELSKSTAKQQMATREKTYLEQETSRLRKLQEQSEKNNLTTGNEIDSLKKEQGNLIEKLSSSKAEIERVEAEKSNTEKQLQETDAIIKRIRDELIRIRARMAAIREARMYMSHGRRAAIREITKIKSKGSVEGICGTVADLISVPPEYSTAVEASAASRLTYLVTKSEDDAARLVEFLKKAKIGRASFLPLDTLRVKAPPEYPKGKGVVGPIKDLIRFNKRYEPAIDYIFGSTLVVRDLDAARSLKHTDLRRVTLDGDLIEPSGLITGGFYEKGKLVGEKQNLPKLEEELKGLEETRKPLSDKLQSLTKSLSELRKNASMDERKLEITAVHLSEKINKTREFEQVHQNAASELNSKNERLEELARDLATLNNVIEKSKESLSALASKEESLRTVLDTSGASTAGGVLKDQENELAKLNGELKKVEISMAENTARIEQLTPQTEEAKKSIDQLRSVIPSLQSELETKQARLNVLNEELKNVSTRRDQARGEVESLRKEWGEKKKNSRDTSRQLGVIRENINTLQMDINGYGIRKEHLESEIASTEKRIQEFPEFQSQSIGEIDEQEVSARIGIIREEQVVLGNVNMKAIEQYATVNESYDEIVKKRDKVLEEKTSILEFMEKIEREKLKKFIDTFSDISNNFKEIFNYLSPTIRAELVLENSDQPLLGGIAIKVRTAGIMEVTNIEALSGGEKSLTALALIFAIQKHHPAPLYIMDEIDAFLDEVNAVRVADLLKELSKTSQFIVVTLKQAVMTRADTLIGVSKDAETGVSSIVSANVEEITKASAT